MTPHFRRLRFYAGRIAILLATTVLATDTPADDWPQWMGPNLDGISTQSDWSTQWPDDQLPIAWSQEIGIGFSSVSIVDDRLYTMGNVDTAESVYCFDATTGEPVWKHSYACELVAVLYEGGPGSTPTVDGDSVYAVGKEGQLMCLAAADGKLRWQKNLQDDLGVPLHEWGFNASPLILDDQVIVAVGRLVSYDKATGEKRWQSEPHTAGYGCVRAFPHDGRRLLATLDSDGLRISDASDGTEVAFTAWKSPFRTNATTPIIHDDTFFISTGYQIGCGLFRLADDELQEIYVNREMRNHFNNSILHKGLLYGFDGNSNLGRVVHLKCMDHKTGEVLWKHRGLGCGSLMIADDKLIVLSDDGRLLVAPASSDGFEPLAEAQILEGRCWTVPVLHNRRVYARNAAGKLVCVQLPSR